MANENQFIALNQDQWNDLIGQFGNLAANVNNPAPAAAAAAAGGRKKLSTFSSGLPADWRVWRRNFRTIAEINGWDDLRQRREAYAAMEGDAARAVSDIQIAAQNQTIDQLLTSYEGRFVPEADGDLARADFLAARQRADETIIVWHTRLRELYMRAFPNQNPNASMQLRNHFAYHLLDPVIKMYVMDQRPATYADCLEVAQNKHANQLIFAATTGAKGMNALINALDPLVASAVIPPESSGGVQAMGNRGFSRGKRTNFRSGGRGRGGSGGKTTCWYCRKDGHVRDDCFEFKKQRDYFQKYLTNQSKFNGAGPSSSRGRGGFHRRTQFSRPTSQPQVNALQEGQEGGEEEYYEEEYYQPEN